MRFLLQLLREPLSQFFAIGGVIFAIYLVVSPQKSPPPQIISIDSERMNQLRSGFESVWRRQPTKTEFEGLIEDYVRGEIYYREALALGLNRDDTVIRQRLRQKMEFLTSAGTDVLTPTDSEVESWYMENKNAYRQKPMLALQQVYLGTDPAPETATALLHKLRNGKIDDYTKLGQRTLLPNDIRSSEPQSVDSIFGAGFFELLVDLPVGIWSEPIPSGFGWHLVRITEIVPGKLPPMDDVRKIVIRDWQADQALKAREIAFTRLRGNYVVKIDGLPAPNVARP
jgi:PPIC-type PPIASE domain